LLPAAGRKLPAERERILLHFADLVEQHSEELAQLETLEQGNPLTFPEPLKWAAP
jgi:acyl-CoA reductase-like NAD-dependent aldehyde dehydrogenase